MHAVCITCDWSRSSTTIVDDEITNKSFNIIIVNNETANEKDFVIVFNVVNKKKEKEQILLISLL